jgi:tripartite motif-containing protein 71
MDVIRMWSADRSGGIRDIPASSGKPQGFFVLVDGNILLHSAGNDRIEKLITSTGTSTVVASVLSTCFDVFVDTSNTIYCSLENENLVISIVLDSTGDISGNIVQKIAGIGGPGAGADMLKSPLGIFVDISFQLYVADCGNHRVQLFPFGETNGRTVVGAGAPETFDLKCPSGIAMDADGHLFIADSERHLIIGSDRNGFRCVIGCFDTNGSGEEHLSHPQSMAFDSYGNIYVVDTSNGRVQQFLLRTTACGKFICFILVFY